MYLESILGPRSCGSLHTLGLEGSYRPLNAKIALPLGASAIEMVGAVKSVVTPLRTETLE
jgi:hypothetical protein